MNLEALNKETHKNLRFKKVGKYTMPYVPITAHEVAACAICGAKLSICFSTKRK